VRRVIPVRLVRWGPLVRPVHLGPLENRVQQPFESSAQTANPLAARCSAMMMKSCSSPIAGLPGMQLFLRASDLPHVACATRLVTR
jgi:hypothetical protein